MQPDPEFLAFSAGIAELLAIASFLGLQTERGRRLAARFDKAVALQRLLNTPRRVCLAAWLVVAVVALFLYVGSPQAAHLYDRHGASALDDGRYSVAVRDFRQAVSLSPRNARAHYNLASAYEIVHDDERAIAEYQVALELDDSFWPAYNNLGRLYLRARDDPDAALAVLLAGQRQADDLLGQAIIGKNTGSAYLEKELPRAALMALREATTSLQALQAQGESVEVYLAEVHRLEALAYQALDSPADARRAWQDSLGYALAVAESEACVSGVSRPPSDCLDALRWAAEARERLGE
jgi:tetratricopeptide (TPR) repeat protein